MGILWGSCFASRFSVVPGVARNGGEAPWLEAAGDVGGVKCLAGAVNFFRNGGDRGACPARGPMAGFAGGYLSAVNRQVTGSSPIAGACESCCLPAGIRNMRICARFWRGIRGVCGAGALRGSWSAVRFLVVQHVSAAGSGALRPGAGRVKCLAGAVHVLRLRAGCMRGAETREPGAAVDSLPGWKRSLIGRMAGVGW